MNWNESIVYRNEEKYLLTNQLLCELENRVRTLLDFDAAENENGYTVSSVYFDDIYDSMYYDTLDGNPFRNKYRIRIYNNSFDVIKLEIKQKKYNRSFKVSSVINRDDMRKLMNGDTIDENSNILEARNMFNIAILNKGLRPRIIIAYDRCAYTYDVGNVRITFDKNIRASIDVNKWYEQGQQGIQNWAYPDEKRIILEVKYDRILPGFISQILECNSLIQVSNSKYGLCRDIYMGR